MALSPVPGSGRGSGHHLTEGAELQITLLGQCPADEFDEDRVHGQHTEGQLLQMALQRDPQALEIAIDLVRTQTQAAEEAGNNANEDDPKFKWAEVTTDPKITRYSSAFYEEFCRLAGFDDFESKGIRFYNALYTLLDRMGVDFFLEVDPRALPEDKFGDLRMIDGPVYVTGDVTKNPEKAVYKADRVFQHTDLPDTPAEVEQMAKADAARMVTALIDVIGKKLGRAYTPPIAAEMDKLMEPVHEEKAERDKIVSIGRNVFKRIKKSSTGTDG